jgi:predicted kinase
MTDSSLARKKKKVTYTASTQGIERAEKALQRLGFESKINFVKSSELYLSRSTVTKFFQRQPIQLDSFKRICEALKLNWKDIVEIIEERQSERLERNNYSSPDTDEVVQVQAVQRQVTVLDKQTKKITVITLEGDINSIGNLKVIECILRENSGNSINIIDIQAGSIRLIVEGSQEDIERLVSRIQSGDLKELSGFPVEDIQILNESSDDEESDELNDKWRLVQEIINYAVGGRNLSDADLSDAKLSHADLSHADLSRADLSHADLIGANLIGANLSDANLFGANLFGANLIGANLIGANLSGASLFGANLIDANLIDANLIDANLSRANVKNARFGNNQGISEPIKHDLTQKRAIFDNSPGDRSSVLLPR